VTGREEKVDEQGRSAEPAPPARSAFDRHAVLEQLGGWRGMLDASLPTVAFLVGNTIGGLRAGIWAAVVAGLLVFALRLVRRESIQQAVSGLLAVVVAVAIASASGHARDYFLLGILRNAAVGVVLIGSIPVRWPLVGVFAEFLAPSHLGEMAGHTMPSLPSLRRRAGGAVAPAAAAESGPPSPGAPPERHWRQDRRMVRTYGWLTLLWGATFLLRVVVAGLLYHSNAVGWLGTASLLLGLPVTGVVLVITLGVIARLHRHRRPERVSPPETEPGPAG
jgi:hypothetical protein